jgi:signal transduction histidine kinase
LWVEDNGIGIAPEHHDRIFMPFERLHHRSEYAGTGIGLAMVKRAIERMGGAVGVTSAHGQGSRFWIELLPAAKRARERGRGSAARPRSAYPLPPL